MQILPLSTGADVAITDNAGETALHKAVSYGNERITRVLLDSGADVTQINHEHATILHLPAARGYEAVALLLLDAGADISALDNSCMAAVYRPVQEGHLELALQFIYRSPIQFWRDKARMGFYSAIPRTVKLLLGF